MTRPTALRRPSALRRRGGRVVAASVLAAGCAIAPLAGPTAAAQGRITVTPNPVPVAANSFTEVRVEWTGQAPDTLVFAGVCVKSTKDPDFQVGIHCSPLAQVETNGTGDGRGSALVPVFRGREPTTDLPWGCYAAGDPVPPGVLGATTCYVLVTSDVVLNNDDAVELAVTVTGANNPVDRGVLGGPVAAAPAPAPAAAAPAPTPTQVAGTTTLAGAPISFTG